MQTIHARAATFNRTAFTTDRTLEFFTESELTTQMGYGRELWPLVIVKELLDNALDACETGDIAPEIWLTLEENAFTVTDNGPGIPAEIVEGSLDYHIRISDKKHYIAPTRGQLGNALKCVWAAPFVANGTHHGVVEVTARGIHHTIDVSLNRIKQLPDLNHTQADASVKNGTSVKVHWNEIASYQMHSGANFYRVGTLAEALRHLLFDFAVFNPHATFHFGDLHFEASNPAWSKWRTDQTPSAYWYTTADLRHLIAAHLAQGDRPVRDFLADFAGLRGTQTRRDVLNEAGITGSRLSDLVTNGDVDLEKVASLLSAMRQNSKPVKPQRLGIIGEHHIKKLCTLAGGGKSLYAKSQDIDNDLPFVLESAFAVTGGKQSKSADEDSEEYETEQPHRRLVIGLNWTPTLKIPSGIISEALNECRIESTDPAILVIHLAQPHLAFTDHGKGALAE